MRSTMMTESSDGIASVATGSKDGSAFSARYSGSSFGAGYSILPPIREMTETGDDGGGSGADNSGEFLCWGCGEFGQHCHGNKKEVSFADGKVDRFCGAIEGRIKLVGCGSSHTVVATNSNELYVWGNGNSGQLGCSDTITHVEPQRIELYARQSSAPVITGISCGGRHTMVWLDNGHVFTFGNNFHAQLGYDFREKKYKENQSQPQLLKALTYKHVVQVACGDKHSIFRFDDGAIACVGNNAHGQIGSDDREESVVPKFLTEVSEPITSVAAGSNHSLAVTESGQAFCWGYGKACGNKTEDILSPRKVPTHRSNVVAVAGGSIHSMALTANGSVYTWGAGPDGQLGQGEKVKFLSVPHRVKYRHVSGKTVQIACGEMFSAAVTEKGYLYLWGKNSHTIVPGKPTSHKIFHPHCMNRHYRPSRVSTVHCGSWHACALFGAPHTVAREGEVSEESAEEEVPESPDHELETPKDAREEVDDAPHLDDSESGEEVDILITQLPREVLLSREKTKVSIAEFYAPTPDLQKDLKSPSPEYYLPGGEEGQSDRPARDAPESGALSKTLVVQMPQQSMGVAALYVDAATSPMTCTTTTRSSTHSSSLASQSGLPSPATQDYGEVNNRPTKADPKRPKRERKFRESTPSMEKDRAKSLTPAISEVVQFSRTSADAFSLPREASILTKQQVDFSDMESARLYGPIRSPDKLSRISRQGRESKESGSISRIRETSPVKFREASPAKSKLRNIDSSTSLKSDSVAFMESPLFRGHRNQNNPLARARRPWDSPVEEEKYPPPRIPRHPPRKKNTPRQADTNFGLQISRSKTIIGPLHSDAMMEQADRLAQLRRYASMHNPHATGMREKARVGMPRHVSIPGGRAESPPQELDQLCVEGLLQGGSKPVFSSGSTWRDRSDLERLQAVASKKGIAAAGIVKMYLENNEVVGSVERPWYPNLIVNTEKGDQGGQDDALIVQPLLKGQLKYKSLENLNLDLPPIGDGVKDAKKHVKRMRKRQEAPEMEVNLSSRSENYIDSRIS